MGQDGVEFEILKFCSLDLFGKLWKVFKGFKEEIWVEQIWVVKYLFCWFVEDEVIIFVFIFLCRFCFIKLYINKVDVYRGIDF